jgi:hypothetical protein
LADITDSRPDILTDTERVGNMHFALKSDGNKKLAFNRLEEFAKKKQIGGKTSNTCVI